jgi:phosphatidylserine/phosphatidylglycerophosphate/cardiolipin synthase-like enzyme
MWFKTKTKISDDFNTKLFDEKTFYSSFIEDLLDCKEEVIIESPFIYLTRMNHLFPIFERLIENNVKVYVITKSAHILEEPLRSYSEKVIREFEILGVHVLATTNNHHRKLAILDRKILWEGSLNILSQTNSREIMRRIQGEEHAQEMFNFLKLKKFI